MTPAIRLLERDDIPHQVLQYTHDAQVTAYGEEAVTALGLAPESVFKTLLAQLDDGRLVVALVPVMATLDLKGLAKAAGARKARMADPALAERTTGYVVGGISPLGQRKRLPTFIDDSALALASLHVSGGRRGLEIGLAPTALIDLLEATTAPLART
ncbi:Cys-tRNA(Pro)/Cys-tRNA(Cys) deacylase [Chromohalobacter marismortui]|uniref:Cys-tRNA(Pro)/Cys-tRNA(Cys) deacylase n=1 Tax=Chromohalobacter marismortui TaxID=42055 RepID=A0A4R7NI02_9GAMM|nr:MULTISPECIES: Cys-tRNA(Pro) deacylase [Chromohalobacter]MCI0510823.1 Cys-tRNA(Pro) deacylase [Chromohalobacter sp.]MCI0592711.1 Cys-tRNA(Pro) deacylase [Chromohalobacter sp.]TDU20245.1 Cys-tRNA(Pro)/Cys-tRNA(Cys) deacylase [Chromohalobacter marismortui]